MTRQRPKTGLLLWALAALALVAVLARFAIGMSQLDDARYAGRWNMRATPITVTAVETPDWGDNNYDYYRLSFELTNNSQRPVETRESSFAVHRGGDDDWDVRLAADWSSDAAYSLRPQLPQGCTGTVELMLRVDPEEVESGADLELLFEDYAGGISLGTFTLP